MRTTTTIEFQLTPALKKQFLTWANTHHEEVVWLDTNAYTEGQTPSRYQAILGVEAFTAIQTNAIGAFERLNEYQQVTKDWILGYLSYDLKNDTERLKSENADALYFPELYFFQPKKLFLFTGKTLEIKYLNMVGDEVNKDLKDIFYTEINTSDKSLLKPENKQVKNKINKEKYLKKIHDILAYIQRGDIYEVNFCQEFYIEKTSIDPLSIYHKLNHISQPPFAVFFKKSQHFLLSASPERYLKKQGSIVVSEPIKGTSKRGKNITEDEHLKKALVNDPKERAENIMIVDLVRNDLSKTATKGSVTVEALCKLCTFKQVHQLISTVQSTINTSETTPVDVIKTTFPMGSMTGAPKLRAMEIIEELEETKRGLYSGSVGYFTPEGDFDFNVVIRSILYNEAEKYVSFSVGGAITSKSNPEKEYEECLLKAKAMKQVLVPM